MKIFKSFSFIFSMSLMMFLSSCDEVIEIESNFESRLVINSFFDPASEWLVDVSHSHNILDNSTNIEPVVNARVIVYDQDNEFLYELYHTTDGQYTREGYYPSSTRGYSIKVISGEKEVTATSYVPEKSKLKINEFLTIVTGDKEGIAVDFEIEDKSNIEAYYLWDVISLMNEDGSANENIGTGGLSDDFLDVLSTDDENLIHDKRDIIGGGVFGNGTYKTTFNSIEGRRFSGVGKPKGKVEYTNSIEIGASEKIEPDDNVVDSETNYSLDPIGGEEDGEEGEANAFRYELRVMSISKELYDFYNSVEESQRFDNNSANPNNDIYSNIHNGLGIFAGFNESVIRF